MQYRQIKDCRKISALGYGCLRFSKQDKKIDIGKAEQEIMLAIQNGVNYFDTAYIYPGSEEALGEILERNHCRKQVYIATKLPYYLLKSLSAVEKTFQEQLSRLRTDYIDFYLMHMLFDINAWNRLKAMGIEDWISTKKASGEIRYIGFSFHGDTATFKELLNAYDWDFCQIQYNYLDEHTQAGRAGLEYAASKGIPVIIMEPLRGGRLVSLLPESAKKSIMAYPIKRTAAEWAFRWLWDQPEVTCVLSGMNSEEMVLENCQVASTAMANSLTVEDKNLIARLRSVIQASLKVGCTGCGYCLPCPRGVDIPNTFRCYNEIDISGKFRARKEYIQITSLRQTPSDFSRCVKCGKCEQHCPQHINIRKGLHQAGRVLCPLYLKAALKLARFFIK